MQTNYFTCRSLKNNTREKNLAVLDLGEVVQYIQSTCAIFCRWFNEFFKGLTVHDDFRT